MAKKQSKTLGNIYSGEIYEKAKKYQKIYGYEIGKGEHDTWNNEADAFKHTFGAADMALKTALGISKYVGDNHEKDGNFKMGQTKGEENMDEWNNAQGRKIAQKIAKEIKNPALLKVWANTEVFDDKIAKEVMNKMKKGELITHPNDSREYDDRSASQKFSDEIKDKLHNMRNERNSRINNKSKSNKPAGKSSKAQNGGGGRWVTVNGAHVLMD